MPFRCAALRLPRTMTPSLRCACALVLVCLLPLLLLRPLGALGEELRLPQPPPRPPPGPRAADWLSNFAHFNKYLEKLFNSSVKSKDPQEIEKRSKPQECREHHKKSTSKHRETSTREC